jgi:hypothetical protein
MINQLTKILKNLLDLPLWSIGRAGSLEWFAFGSERREIPLKNGKYKTVSDYALHVQCSWRIRDKNKILIASRDRFYPSGADPYAEIDNFEWDKDGANQLDQRITEFMARETLPLNVRQIVADDIGSFKLKLNDTYFFEVFPDNSIATEYWRLFRPYSDQEHFVCTNEGIKRE